MIQDHITVGVSVTVPRWNDKKVYTVVKDHGHEVTLSSGERVYKALCFPVGGVKGIITARKKK